MSIFDPFSLYVHRQVNTKKGQVIQKKPYIPEQNAISPEQIQQAYKILHSVGVATIPLPYFNNILERTVAQRFEASTLSPGYNSIYINDIINLRRENLADISSIPLENIDYMRLQVLITEIYISHTSTNNLILSVITGNFIKQLSADTRAVAIVPTSAARNHYIGRLDNLNPIFDTILKDPQDQFVSSISFTDKETIKQIFDGTRREQFITFSSGSEQEITITTNVQVILSLSVKLK